MIKGGSERKKEVAGAEAEHNFPGEVLAKGQSSHGPSWVWEPEGCPSQGLWCDGGAGTPLGTPPPPEMQEPSENITQGRGEAKPDSETAE